MDKNTEIENRPVIKHSIKPSANALYGALIPIGNYLHRDIQDAPIGSDIVFFDGVAVLLGKSIISAPSIIADTLCMMLYGRDSKYIYNRLKQNWKIEMDDNILMFITYKNKLELKENESK